MARKKRSFWANLFRLALILLAVAVCWNLLEQHAYPLKYQKQILLYAEEYHLQPQLLFAVVRTESEFNPNAVSSANARGLTQITPETFVWLQSKTGENLPQDALFEPEVSIRYAAFFLSLLLAEFGNEDTAICAYHAGRGIVNQWLRNPAYCADGKQLSTIPYKATEHYLAKVKSARDIYTKRLKKIR
jgi:soluble lytic murein transglycosylase